MRISIAKINKLGYSHYPMTQEKYYMDEPTKRCVRSKKESLLHPASTEYSTYPILMGEEVYKYDGVYGEGYMTDSGRIVDCTVELQFRGIKYTLELINDGLQRGFCVHGEAPNKKHIVYVSNRTYITLSPVKNPKYRLSKDVVKMMLQYNNLDEGKFMKAAKKTALDIMEEEVDEPDRVIYLGK